MKAHAYTGENSFNKGQSMLLLALKRAIFASQKVRPGILDKML